MRVTPRPLITVGLAIGYITIMVITWAVVGLDYDAVGDSTSTILEGIVLPVALASAFLAGATSYLGWWGPAIREQLRAPRWLWAVPALMVLPGLGSLLGGFEPAGRTASYLLALGVGTLLVGFGEEMLTRGTGLVGLRGGFNEVLSWFFSCLIFGLLHAVNVFFGQSLGSTVQQILIAFLAGSVLYITRRVSGTLIVAMILHAWIDFTTFAFSEAATDAESPLMVLSFAQWAAFVIAVIGVVVVLRRGTPDRRHDPQDALAVS
ncbi:CPBP family intramembrane metalloprotease [Nostocoides sp. F2B08]|uniref:CPBP family intramembrane glutamic endopeptidase n=1 Tax=Nostocoides sp. F2B08 TaxID=2653936 RepID=UPI001263982A|nr:CPBP family intramembrane glutamic endopeptidase [Tetrasphaera sp. F2B08]KAB7743989.1 CPBP family intramembrane metalloprotease [Tetrasphaera sp. F2B08]